MKRALVVSFTDLSRDSRVNRQIRSLARELEVVAVGTAPPQLEGVHFIGCQRIHRSFRTRLADAALLALGFDETYYSRQSHIRQARERLAGLSADVVIANDLEALPLALQVARGSPVVFDAHEYSPGEHEGLRWRLVRQRYAERLCRRLLPRVAGMMTVADGIAREYTNCYGVHPEVIHNAPRYEELRPSATRDGMVRMIHHGSAIRSRRIELMLDAMGYLDDRFRLDVMLVPSSPGYLDDLRARAAGDPRIRFLPPVPMPELVRFANDYDVGMFLLAPTSINSQYALPNKFFEFVQSRLAVAIGPSPEMSTLARKYGFGIIADDFSPASLARALCGVDRAALERLKGNANSAARELCFDRVEPRLLSVVRRALETV
jgi:hypothetical protein